MKRRTFGIGVVATLAVAGCSDSKFTRYHGPKVTSVVVNKGERKLYLLHNEQILKQYQFDLGFAPVGDKKIEGDGKTPEGTYLINRRNPNSAFHLSIGISYPNTQDRADAAALGKTPGGEIFIHGQPNLKRAKGRDWTAGCIAVKDNEIEQIYAMVDDGTLITLRP
jgi:murein L,D-transpeptidase YafK